MADMGAVQGLPAMSDAEGAYRRSELMKMVQPSGGNGIFSAIPAGVHSMRAGMGGFVQAVGQAVGAQGVADWGKSVADSQTAEAQKAGSDELAQHPWTPSGIAYSLLGGLPQLGAAMVGGKVGGALSGRLGMTRDAASMLGAGAVMYPGMVGGNVEAAKAGNNGELSQGQALGALVMGAPEAYMAAKVPGGMEARLRDSAAGTMGQRFMSGAVENAKLGAAQGAANTAMTGLFDPSKSIADRASDVVQGALQGGFQGGVIGGLAHVIGGRAKVDQHAPDAELEQTIDQSLEPAKPQTPIDVTFNETPALPAPAHPLALPAPDAQAQLTAEQRLQLEYKPATAPTETGVDGQVGLQLPDQLKPQIEPAGAGDHNPATVIDPANVGGRQMSLFTQDEAGERAPAAMAMRNQLRDMIGKTELNPKTDLSFIDKLSATNQPELVKALREQVGRYDRDNDGKMPSWFKSLAETYGIVDQTGKSRSVADDHASLLQQVEAQKTAVDAPYQTLMDRASARGADTPQAKIIVDRANKLRAENDDKVAGLQKQADDLKPLVDLHAQADALPDQFEPKQVPDTLKDDPKAQTLYQQMELLRDHSPDAKVAERAAQASDLLRQGQTEKTRRAEKIAQDFADRVARDKLQGEPQAEKPVATEANRAADDVTQPEPVPDTTVDVDAANRAAGTIPETPSEHEAAVTAPNPTPSKEAQITALKVQQRSEADQAAFNEAYHNRNFAALKKTEPGLTQEQYDYRRKSGMAMLGQMLNDKTSTTMQDAAIKAAQGLSKQEALKKTTAVDMPASEFTPEQHRAEILDRATRDQMQREADKQAAIKARLAQTEGPKVDASKAANLTVKSEAPKMNSVERLLQMRQASKDALKNMAEPANRTQRDVDVEHLIANGASGGEILKHIELMSNDPNLRLLAKKLQRMGIDPTVAYGDKATIEKDALDTQNKHFDADGASAAYNETTNHVWLQDRTNTHLNFMHEMMHAATWKAIEDGSPTAKRMQDLFDRVKSAHAVTEDAAAGKVPYGLENLHEFVAEAFTNPWFRDTLSKVTVPGEPKTLWGQFKDIIKKMMGLPGERKRTALDEMMDMGQNLMDENKASSRTLPSEAEMAKRISDEHEKVGIVGKGVFDMAKESLAKLSNEAGLKGMASKASKFLDYNMTRTQMIRRHADEFASGATKNMEAAWQAHTSIGQAAATTGFHVKAALDSIKDVPTRNAALKDAMWASQIGAHPFKSFAEQPQLHKRADRAIIQPEIDRIAKAFNDSYRQKGARAALEQVHAVGEAQNASEMLLQLHAFMKTTGLGDMVQGHDAHDVFASTATDHTPANAAKFYRGVLDTQVAALNDHIKQAEGAVAHLNDGDPTKKGVQQQLKGLKKQLGDVHDNLLTHEQAPYMPSGREGDFAAAFSLKMDDANPGKIHPRALAALQDGLDKLNLNVGINQHTDNNSVFIRTDTLDKAQQIADLAQALGKAGHLDPKGDAPLAKRLDEDAMLNRTRPAWVKTMMDSLAQDSSIPQAQRDAIHDQLRRTWADVLPSRDVVQLARKNVQGFSTDIGRAIDRRNSVWTNTLANLATQDRKNAAFGQMRDDIKGLERQPDLSKTVSAQNCLNELAEREAGRDWRPQSTMGDTIRSGLHAWQLGVSPAYFVLELSQAPMFVLPALSAERGIGASTKALTSNLAMTTKVMRAIASSNMGKYGIMTAEGLKQAGIPKNVADHLLKVNNRGWFENSATRELGMSADGRAQNMSQKAIHWANISALYTEVAMHVNTALAVKSLHDAKPFADGLDAATDRIMEKGHWKWGAGENARSMGKTGFAGKATPYLTQFMGWQMKALETYYRELGTSFSKDATPAERMQSIKFIGGHMAAVVAFSGISGLPTTPLMGMATKVMNGLTGSDSYDFEQSYRSYLTQMFGKEFGDAMARGLPHLAGIDMSDVGDEGLIPGGKFLADQRKWEDAAKDASWRAMGASVGFAGNVVKAFREISNGNTENGIRALLPATLRNPYEAWQMARHGYEDQSGVQSPIQPTTADVWKKALGVEPASMKQNDDIKEQVERTLEMRRYVTGYAESNLKRAFAHGDNPALQTSLQTLMESNQRNPGVQVNPQRVLSTFQRENVMSRLGMPGGSAKDIRLQQQGSPYYIPGK